MHIALIGLLLASASAAAGADAGRVRVGYQAAFGIEQDHLFGSGPSSGVRLLMLQPQLAVGILQAGKKPQLEFVVEPTFAESLGPARRFILSVNLGFRTHVFPARRIGGYLELGAGPGSSALHNPDIPNLNGWLQYHLQVGGGLRVPAGCGALQAGYRLTHLSNNRTTPPNLGLNLHTLVVSFQTCSF